MGLISAGLRREYCFIFVRLARRHCILLRPESKHEYSQIISVFACACAYILTRLLGQRPRMTRGRRKSGGVGGGLGVGGWGGGEGA